MKGSFMKHRCQSESISEAKYELQSLWIGQLCESWVAAGSWDAPSGTAGQKHGRRQLGVTELGKASSNLLFYCTLRLTNRTGRSRAGQVTSFSFRNQCPSRNCHLGEGPRCPQESYQSYWCQSGLQPNRNVSGGNGMLDAQILSSNVNIINTAIKKLNNNLCLHCLCIIQCLKYQPI